MSCPLALVGGRARRQARRGAEGARDVWHANERRSLVPALSAIDDPAACMCSAAECRRAGKQPSMRRLPSWPTGLLSDSYMNIGGPRLAALQRQRRFVRVDRAGRSGP
jgi:hypothetical protein